MSKKQTPHFSLSQFLKDRLFETVGGLLAGSSLFLLASFASYSVFDPSWNYSTSAPVTNWMGPLGASAADGAFQFLGLASYVPTIFLLAMGIYIFWTRRLSSLLWRFPMILIATIFLSSLLDAWHAGGALGMSLVRPLNYLSETYLHLNSSFLISCLYGSLSGLLFFLALPIHPRSFLLPFKIIQYIKAALPEKTERVRTKPMPRNKNISMRGYVNDDEADLSPQPLERLMPRISVDKSVDRHEEKTTPAPRTITPKKPRVSEGDHDLPPIDLLHMPKNPRINIQIDEEALSAQAALLEEVLQDYGVKGEIINVRPGPVVTLYELEPAPGLKSSRVIGLADDIARSMSAISARVAVVPGKNVIGIELPNPQREIVHLHEMLASKEFSQNSLNLALALGKDIGGEPVFADLSRMPHLLVAGTTGSGKSVAINTMILSLLYRLPPEKCKFIMIDPKMLELSVYDGIPHLLAPVVTDPRKAIVALKWVVREMESRYQAMSKLSVRNIEGYNARIKEANARGEVLTRRVQTGFDPESGSPIFEDQPLGMEALPFIVVVVDEMADLMLVAGKDIESAVQRLAQMARAAGIHLIMATQRPSVDVITGTIKANFPTRISFQVTSKIDSRTILGESGAEQLLGQGDMLYMAAGGKVSRIHGPYVRDQDVEQVVKFLKSQGGPQYAEDITEDRGGENGGFPSAGEGEDADELFEQALALVYREKKASTSFIQRHFKIGYNRAARIIDQMEAEGIVSSPNHVGKREVLAGGDSDAA